MYKSFFYAVFLLVLSFTTNAQNLKGFALLGSEGIGLGLKYKKATLYTRYFYEYHVDIDNDRYYYYHYPAVGITYNVVEEQNVKLYTGLEFRNRIYKQKYFFPGTFNTNNFWVSVPLGIEVTPLKKFKNISIVLETGLQLEHTPPIHPDGYYDWDINLWRGIIELRYQFGKRIRN